MQVDWNDRYAQETTPWDNPDPCGELKRLVSEGAIRPCRAVDLGCGTGSDAIFLAQQGFDVTAIDSSPLAIQKAQQKAARSRASVRFAVGSVLEGLEALEPGLAVPFVLDNGLYHYLRTVDFPRYLEVVGGLVQPGGSYVTFAGNPNDTDSVAGGPFRVSAGEICTDFEPLFELRQLREFRFHAVERPQGGQYSPLGWSALFRRKH